MEKRTSPYVNDKLFYKNFRGGYVTAEYMWRDHQQWLQEQGYMPLRPRYRPDWKPSWAGTKQDDEDFEDGLILEVCAAWFRAVIPVSCYYIWRGSPETGGHGCNAYF